LTSQPPLATCYAKRPTAVSHTLFAIG